MSRIRLTGNQRRNAIVDAAVTIANGKSLAEVNFRSIADCVAVPTSERLIRYHFGTKERLMRAVADHDRASAAVVEEARILGVK